MVQGVRATAENLLGTAPHMCPWRAYRSPIVNDVTAAFPLFESGQLHMMVGNDPPLRIVQGCVVFKRALDVIRANDLKTKAQQQEANAKAAAALRRRGRRG